MLIITKSESIWKDDKCKCENCHQEFDRVYELCAGNIRGKVVEIYLCTACLTRLQEHITDALN